MTLPKTQNRNFLYFCSVCLFLSSICVKAFAETLEVEYKSFYSHVNKLKGEETEALQFAFGFLNIQNGELCQINQARISTEKQQIPLQVSKENRFTVPSDKILKLAKAKVIIELQEAANICDMSVQLETKPEYLNTKYSQDDIAYLFNQYAAFFDEMGGFLSFMMPKVVGLKIYLQDLEPSTTNIDGLTIDDGAIHIHESQIPSYKALNLPSKPLRITAITDK